MRIAAFEPDKNQRTTYEPVDLAELFLFQVLFVFKVSLTNCSCAVIILVAGNKIIPEPETIVNAINIYNKLISG